jgi:hypothetical protein
MLGGRDDGSMDEIKKKKNKKKKKKNSRRRGVVRVARARRGYIGLT